jgi:chemotaxis protein methyltransferase CheR
VTPQDFEFITGIVRARSGIVLAADKMYLLESRLAPLARKEGLASVIDLINVVRARREERLIGQVVDAMTTNETFFFRDKTPFDHLKEGILPKVAPLRRGSRIRVWCAASSTGQEPYSIAMMLDQQPLLSGGVPVEIVATDISERCLEKARQGLYSQFEVQRGLPIQMLMQYFTQQEDQWRLSEKIRGMVSYRKQNLLEPYTALGRFDIVFCRNVLIYFDNPTKTQILTKIADMLNPGGFLVLGAAETVFGLNTPFEANTDRRGLYQVAAKAGATKVA